MNQHAIAALFAGLLLGLMLAACSNQQPQPPEDMPARANADADVTLRPDTTTPIPAAEERVRLEQVQVTGARIKQSDFAAGFQSVGRLPSEPLNRENYAHYQSNPVIVAAEHPVSTFSVDVDTGGYANVRRLLEDGRLPPEDAVRVEEMINYFSYAYPQPDDKSVPFSVHTELAPTPWNADSLLLQIGLRGYTPPSAARPAANLVFLIDVSGSMRSPDKLDLLKSALKLLIRQLDGADRIAMVVYAGAAGMVLPPTPGDRHGEILAAVEQLNAGGSTNGGAGILLAYELARQGHIRNGINRVLLATDGDFNVGTVNFEQLIDMVERERAAGIMPTTLGFGTGNYNDHLLEQLADKGNGNYAYIDSLKEGRKVLVEEMQSTLQTIAGDVKAQIEFNPAVVAEYRLIGYENRLLNREDFSNDAIDAGDIGAGHTVTALYEIVLNGSGGRRIAPLRYADSPASDGPHGDELAYLKLRYKLPDESSSRLLEQPVRLSSKTATPSADFRFAAAVAAFGQKLRGGGYLGEFDYRAIHTLAREARGRDPHGYRGEFLGLLELAQTLSGAPQQAYAD